LPALKKFPLIHPNRQQGGIKIGGIAAMIDRRALLKLSLLGAVAGEPVLLPASSSATESELAAPRRARWIVLGSKGGPRVTTGRSNPANVLLVDDVPYIIDCGIGISKRLVEADVPLPNIRYVFVTHLHSDHVLEFGNMIDASWSVGLNHEVQAFGPVGLEALAKAYWESNRADIEIRIPDEGKPDPRKLLVVNDITESGPVMGNDKVKVTAFRTPHPPILERNYAYRFETPDGVIVYACDTAYNPELAKFAQGADLLIHEALYLPGVDRMTSRIKNASTLKEHLLASHTSTEDVGRVAQAAGVKKLVMSHLVPGDDPSITDEMWMEGARKHYDGPIVVAHDLMEINL
jgi:ribonuclease BN (tRNA processing enzyme)